MAEEVKFKSVKIKPGKKKIEARTFAGCMDCGESEFPYGLVEIGEAAFYHFHGGKPMVFPDTVRKVGKYAFALSRIPEISFPKGIEEFPDGLFQGSTLETFHIPESVKRIGICAFEGCENLSDLNFPEGLETIGDYAFRDTKLREVTLPESLTTIGCFAFGGCKMLESFHGKFASEDHRSLIIEGSVRAFAPAQCTEYAIPEGTTAIGCRAFSCCRELKSVTLPESVTTIGASAFSSCSSLQNIRIPAGVTEIGDHAFAYCVSLERIVLPEGLTRIGKHTFDGCQNLKEIVIPDSVTEIEEGAFWGCTDLKTVAIPGKVTVGPYAFSDDIEVCRRD